MPTPTVELEPAQAPLPVGPIALWQPAMVTKYEWMLIEFSRDGTSWTLIQRSNYYSLNTAKQLFLGFENVVAREAG